MNASLFRLRCAYPKSDRLSFLGHLELIATVERSIRRAGLPFAVSNGFARRMRIQFSSALPVGVSSLAEYFDLFLTERLDEDDALATIAAYSPAPLRPVRASYMPSSLPALEAWLDRSSWTLDLGSSIDEALAEDAISALRRKGTFTYLRGTKEKTVDVSAGYVSHALSEGEGGLSLSLATLSTPSGAMRPEAFVRAAFDLVGARGALPEYLRCVRVAQHHLEDGALVEPYELSLPKLVD